MARGIYILFVALSLVAAPAMARSQKTPGLKGPVMEAEGKEKPKSGAKPILAVTLRPTWYQSEPTFEMQNTAELGVQFTEKFALSYVQDFSTNVSKTGSLADAGDFTPTWYDGFIRMNFKKVSESDDKLFSFSDQVRVYLPTDPTKREAGFITTIRNYFVFDRKVTGSMGFTFYEVPILHVYDRAGTTDDKGKGTASPIFENRIILEPTVEIVPKVTLGLPLNFHVVKFREFDKAENSGEWVPTLTFSPWIEWQMTDLLLLGFYYETASVAKKTDAGLVWTDGQHTGYYQAYLKIAL
jgi:hypothetical protein